MKIKLKEITFDNLNGESYTICTTSMGKIYNLNESYEFQTPKIKVQSIGDDYITLQLLPSEASKIFFTKIKEFETKIMETFQKPVSSLFVEDTFKIKIKKNQFKVYSNGNLFNIYYLEPGSTVICLVSILKLWLNF